jgi:hypothetical protein
MIDKSIHTGVNMVSSCSLTRKWKMQNSSTLEERTDVEGKKGKKLIGRDSHKHPRRNHTLTEVKDKKQM